MLRCAKRATLDRSRSNRAPPHVRYALTGFEHVLLDLDSSECLFCLPSFLGNPICRSVLGSEAFFFDPLFCSSCICAHISPLCRLAPSDSSTQRPTKRPAPSAQQEQSVSQQAQGLSSFLIYLFECFVDVSRLCLVAYLVMLISPLCQLNKPQVVSPNRILTQFFPIFSPPQARSATPRV